ncbi:GntR family transcriptional regulator [Litorisediminicola beolgyonensis]|uniref:GntR family transcriptional regulator n=1 Tax=Litorisediminicola beolgyonensis TaxID=1173614 RepID=A0ABW3ZJR1_9RHOB
MKPARASEDAIFQSLREAILTRKLAPGTRLREIRLGEILGASRGNVRKALDRLSYEGLVEQEPNRGASVAQPTAQEAEDLFAARKCIEVAIALMAAEKLTPQAVKKLEKHIAREQTAREKAAWAKVVALSGEFHTLIAEIAGNAPLQRYLNDLVARESLIIQMFGTRQQDVCTQNEHAEILEALQSGDADLIARRIEDHIDGIAAGVDLNPRDTDPRTLEEILLG